MALFFQPTTFETQNARDLHFAGVSDDALFFRQLANGFLHIPDKPMIG
jgi:hypothetical protein